MTILSFNTEAAAQACLDQIDAVGLKLYENAGYTIQDRAVVGKNASTGKPDVNAAKTTTWDTVKKAFNQDKWYIANPRSRFPEYFDQLTQGHDFDEIDLPDDWVEKID